MSSSDSGGRHRTLSPLSQTCQGLQLGLKVQTEVCQADKADRAFQAEGRASAEAQRTGELEGQQETTKEGQEGHFVQEVPHLADWPGCLVGFLKYTT